MEPFSAAYLSSLAAGLTQGVITGLGRALRAQIEGKPVQQALSRSLEVGIVALVAQSTAAAPEHEFLLRDIFDEFFHDPAVGGQIASLLRGHGYDRERLALLFAEAGYVADQLPGLKLNDGLDAFAAAFLASADGEPTFQGLIQIGQLRQQTGLQAELLAQMKELVAAFREQTVVSVRAGNVVEEGSGRTIYQWSIEKYVGQDEVGEDKYEFSGKLPGAQISITKNIYPSQPTADKTDKRPSINYLPRHAPFFGRDSEMRIAIEALHSADRGWGIIIVGMGGIGKTALAVEVAHRCLLQQMFKVCLFTTAKRTELYPIQQEVWDQIATFDEMLDELARQLGTKRLIRLKGEEKRKIFDEELRSKSSQLTRILIVFDNLETLPDKEQYDILHFLRKLPPDCKAIVTSRRSVAESAMMLRLDALDRKAAQELIDAELRRTPQFHQLVKQVQREDWSALIDAVGGSPLALQLCLGLMRNKNFELNRVIELVRAGDIDDGRYLDFIFQEIETDMTKSDWLTLSVLQRLPPTAEFDSLLDALEFAPRELESVLNRLIDYSVVNPQGSRGPYGINASTQQWIDRYLRENPQVALKRYILTGDFREATSFIVADYIAAPGHPMFRESELRVALSQYLTWVHERYGQIYLRGFHNDAKIQNLTLDSIYVYPNIQTFSQDETISKRPFTVKDLQGVLSEEKIAPLNQLSMLGPRILLLGDPGSGKTTFLCMVANTLAQAILNGNNSIAVEKLGLIGPLPLPIFISLADYLAFRKVFSQADVPERGTLLDYARSMLISQYSASPLLPEDFFARLSSGSSLMFLLDGLDEMLNDEDRALVIHEVENLAFYARAAYIIVTSRTLAFRRIPLRAHFRPIVIKPMSLMQVDELIDRWCDTVYDESDSQVRSERLRSAIVGLERSRAQKGLSPLIDTPLMTLIAAIISENANGIPENRAALYDEFVKLMLEKELRLISESNGTLVQRIGTLTNIREYLGYLAFKMMSVGEQSGREIDESELSNLLLPLLAERYGQEESREYLSAMLSNIDMNGNLLHERGGLYRFANLSFQEFFAASYLVDTVWDIERIITSIVDSGYLVSPWWRETILLILLYTSTRSHEQAIRMLQQLCNLSHQDEATTLAAVELAGTAYLELGFQDQPTYTLIKNRLAVLLTAENIAVPNPLRGLAGVLLGRLGDPRTDVNCDIPSMADVPAGPFLMGSKKGKDQGEDDLAFDAELPQHEVFLSAYRIGKYPVTVVQFRRFIAQGGYSNKEFWTPKGWSLRESEGWMKPLYWDDPKLTIDNHPVVGVSWYEAAAYCVWLHATTGRFFRLPDEAMWEKAARGTDGRRWPWGNAWDATRLNAGNVIGSTSAVGIFINNKSPFSVYDTVGNVWEWCSGPGAIESPYPFIVRSYGEDLDNSPFLRASRGGAWDTGDRITRIAYRDALSPFWRDSGVGFRVAEDLS